MEKKASMTRLEETWRPVVGYEGLYEVSEHGNVRRILFHNGRFQKPRITMKFPAFSNGYMTFGLWKDGKCKTCLAHRMVLMAFVGPAPPLHQAAHLDGNRSNNHVSNLMWATQKENESHKLIHGTRAWGERQHNSKLTEKDIRKIRKEYVKGRVTCFDLARKFNCSFSNICLIVRRLAWKHVLP